MAKTTSKKLVAKKQASKRSINIKKPQTKKASNKSVSKPQSFKLAKPDAPFFTFKITKQTLYWIILAFVFVAFGFWLLRIENDVQRLYDQIETSNQAILEVSE